MPLHHRFSHEDKTIYVDCRGEVTVAAAIDCWVTIRSDPAFTSEFAMLADIRNADYELSVTDLREFAAQLSARKQGLPDRVAFVVPAGRKFSLASLASVFIELAGMCVVPFTDPDEARGWLCEQQVG